MTKEIKSFSLLMCAVMLLAVLAGCKPSGNPVTTAAPNIPETETSSADTTREAVLDIPDEYIFSSLASSSETEVISYDFRKGDISKLKKDSGLNFTLGTNFTCDEFGLQCSEAVWDSVGIVRGVGENPYTAKACFTSVAGSKSDNTAALGVGVRCATPSALFIDSGIWAMCKSSQITYTVKGNFTLKAEYPGIDFANGAEITVEDNVNKISFYYTVPQGEKTLAAYADLSGNNLILYSADGTVLKECNGQPLAETGYFRTMSHFVKGTVSSMELKLTKPSELYSNTDVTYFKTGKFYGFCGLYKHDNNKEQTAVTFEDNGKVYTTAEFLAACTGFEFTANGSEAVLTYGENKLIFTVNKAKVSINGTDYGAEAPVLKDGVIYLSAASFADIIGFDYEHDGEYSYICSPAGKISDVKTAAAERYALYDSTVFNYEDVECNMTGAGKYDPVPFDERLVGIAYTTWHRASTDWSGKSTWDIPLLGGYMSDNREVIRQHAQWLAYAGVDFIFIDWSNNIAYDPATMRDSREDFRMIEESVIDVFEVFAEVENAPKICIFTGPGHYGKDALTNGLMKAKNDQIYNTFIANEKYNKMYFYYEGKPLLLCYGATPSFNQTSKDIYKDDRFTMRWVTGYVGQQGSLCNITTLVSRAHWSWEERGAQTFTVLNKTMPECMTVVASWRSQGKEGDKDYISAGTRNNGATFKEQWQRADEIGVKLVIIVSFNEWTKGEQPSTEISKDIEPSKTFGTFYLDLMKEQIKKFKGKITAE